MPFDFHKLVSGSAAALLRETIREAKGNEVFFLARPDEHGVVVEVTPLARGNDSAVPALLQVTSSGDVVIHNHPSGYLAPSSADVSLASEYGNQGVGFYIINNDADDIYVVVEAFKCQQHQPVDLDQLSAQISVNGRVAKQLKGFESRTEQQRMLRTVATAFNESKAALIEAGTGTGKSLAYLLPSIHWAVHNKQRVVVSTNTINLQEQLMHKDLPFLQQALDLKFKPVLVKGRQNYVCLSKVEALEKEGDYLIETDERTELKAILEWSHRTSEGSRSDLSILPKFSVWEKVACESDNCSRIRCSHYNTCFFYNARREAASADLLIVNHHLLFADLAVRGDTGRYNEAAILPAYSRVILDEAHNVEDVATDYFGTQVAKLGLLRLLGRFYSLRERDKVREKGLLPHLLARLRTLEQKIDPGSYSRIYGHIQGKLITLREDLAQAVEHTFDELALWFTDHSEPGGEQKIRFTAQIRQRPEWTTSILPAVQNLVREMGEFHQQLLLLEKWLESLDEPVAESLLSLAVELSALVDRLESAAVTLGEIFGEPDNAQVRWIEIAPGRLGPRVTLKQAPVNVAAMLRDRLFEKLETVVLTSATLTTEARFDYVKSRLGLDQVQPGRLLENILPSSFDYTRQVILGIPQDIPSPVHRNFAAELERLVLESIQISQGRALVLFTSYALLRRIHDELAPTLESAGIRTLMQGEGPRHRLMETFKQDKTSVLFATDSFWEGVDVAGEALENVILTKLPFSVPKEPVIEARIEAIEQAGGNPFLEYSVPQAVIKFKQGFGRLIRSTSDRGCIMIFDRRVVDKTYGRIFLSSLPKCRVARGTRERVFSEVKQFFEDTSKRARWADRP